jgi:cytokinin dehydrogenase
MFDTSISKYSSRRRFGKMLALGASIVGFNPLSRAWISAANAAETGPFVDIPELDGELHLSRIICEKYADDFGQIVHEQPIAVLRPRSVNDIVAMVRFAGSHQLQIAARGQGHSLSGQTQVRNGIVIDMRTMQAIYSIESDRMTVDAGCHWSDVIQPAFARGLIPPVLTDYQGLTVGGTVSIGGISPESFEHGSQADNVLSLDVVTGTGEQLTCSDSQNISLFEAALAGQGQCCIIVRVTLRLVPATQLVRVYSLPYADLKTVMDDSVKLIQAGTFNGVVTYISPSQDGWNYVLNCLAYFDKTNPPDDQALLAGLNYLPGAEEVVNLPFDKYLFRLGDVPPGPPSPCLTQLVPASKAVPYIADALARVKPTSEAQSIFVQLFTWNTDRFHRPLFRAPSEAVAFGLGMLRNVYDAAGVEGVVKQNRSLYEQNRRQGGTLYPFSVLPMSKLDWQLHYGSAWDGLVDAKLRFDPLNVFASGPDLFR